MTILYLPWLEAAILLMLIGAVCVSLMRRPLHAYHWGQAFTGASCACALVAWLGYCLSDSPVDAGEGSLQNYLFGKRIFAMDELNAPLLPAVALLHFLIALATGRTKMRRFSFSWSLASGAIRLAMFSCTDARMLVGLLLADTLPPCVELVNQERSLRVYLVHMGLFVCLLCAGWAFFLSPATAAAPPDYAAALLLAALLIRSGTVPAHCWMTDWFEHASFGIALLSQAPLASIYAIVRLVLPVAPDWMLRDFGLASLVTAVYAAGMATVQRDVRRFFAYLLLSHSSLVLVGLELHSVLSLTGALCLWFSLILSLGGFGLTLRALESRFGRLSLKEYLGLYDHSPTLAVCFLLTGLASVGFPGTLGFISTELLVDGTIEVNHFFGLVVIAVAALNGIAVLRVYFLLFTGASHVSTVSLRIGIRERIAVLTLAGLVLGGGLVPQPGVATRARAAEEILDNRPRKLLRNTPPEKLPQGHSVPSTGR